MFVKSYKSCYYAKSNLVCTFLPLNTVMKPLTNLDWWLFYIVFEVFERDSQWIIKFGKQGGKIYEENQSDEHFRDSSRSD